MKEGVLDKEVFDQIFKDLVKKYFSMMRGHVIINTFDMVKELWKRYRVPYKKQATVVREKMREWWNSYEWRSKPRPHKMVCGYAVYLSQPMGFDYCMLEQRGRNGFSLICLYPFPQDDFQEKNLGER